MKKKVDDLVKQLEDPRLVEQLKEHGFSIKQKTAVARKTFIIDPAALDEFMAVVNQGNVSIKDAVSEALRDYAHKKKRKSRS